MGSPGREPAAGVVSIRRRVTRRWRAIVGALVASGLSLGALLVLTDVGGDKSVTARVKLSPSSGPPGTLVTIIGDDFTELARNQPREGVTVFLVRPEGNRLRIAPIWTMGLGREGDFSLAVPVPYSLELFPPSRPGETTPRVVIAKPGNLQVAVGSPANRIPGAVFRVGKAYAGMSYPHRLVNKCRLLATVFDNAFWRSDPPLALGPGGRPRGWHEMDPDGTFTLLFSTDWAEYRNPAGDAARFRRQTTTAGC